MMSEERLVELERAGETPELNAEVRRLQQQVRELEAAQLPTPQRPRSAWQSIGKTKVIFGGPR